MNSDGKLAYAEPMAAALAVWDIPEVSSASRLAVVGEGRIAELTVRVVEARRSKAGTSAPLKIRWASDRLQRPRFPSGESPSGALAAGLDACLARCGH